MPYYFIVALQIFCVYHWFKHRNDYYWLFLIIFLPLIGCAIYLITQVYNKRDIDKIQGELTTIINPSKKIKDLEKALAFSETFQNRVNLADAYYESKDFQNAIIHYEEAIAMGFQNNTYVILQLVKSYYFLEDFQKVVAYAEKVQDHVDFKGTKAQFFYGIALGKLGNTALAETHMKAIDQRFSNYEERLVLAQFYLEQNNTTDAKDLLNELYTESQHMTAFNKRTHRHTIHQVEQLLKTL